MRSPLKIVSHFKLDFRLLSNSNYVEKLKQLHEKNLEVIIKKKK